MDQTAVASYGSFRLQTPTDEHHSLALDEDSWFCVENCAEALPLIATAPASEYPVAADRHHYPKFG